ncbi:MAG: response regulator, partial [Leptospiraceae bacterium]|nr:response regulator [Leptospiraceae bacterium]
MKILVIDNSATIRVMLKDFYKNLGYEVDEAKTSEEAIEFFEHSNYTLVTISQMLTSLTGLMVIEKFREIETLRKDKRITPILMISTNDNIETRVKAFEAGASEFITKPFTFQELNDKSKEAIQPDNIFEGS